MIEEGKIYEVKKEFLPLLNVTMHQWERRKEDLLEWWEEFFNYEIIGKSPIMIKINENFL